jgi:hypothetical protein
MLSGDRGIRDDQVIPARAANGDLALGQPAFTRLRNANSSQARAFRSTPPLPSSQDSNPPWSRGLVSPPRNSTRFYANPNPPSRPPRAISFARPIF